MNEKLRRRIETFKAGDYVRAINGIELTETEVKMLRLHYETPTNLATAANLARGMGWPNHSSWNLRYGTLARKIAKELELPSNPDFDWIFIFSTFDKPNDGDWRLILRPQLGRALETTGLVDGGDFLDSDLLQVDVPITEGRPRLSLHCSYERSRIAREKCLEEYGDSCAICGMNFGEVYGDSAAGFIHVHHLKPISEINGEYVIDPVKDLRPVCPNCHAVIHLRKEPYSIEEVQSMLNLE